MKKNWQIKNENLNLKYIEETKPMGTAGSMFLKKKLNQNFFVINCDVWSKLKLMKLMNFIKKKKLILQY